MAGDAGVEERLAATGRAPDRQGVRMSEWTLRGLELRLNRVLYTPAPMAQDKVHAHLIPKGC